MTAKVIEFGLARPHARDPGGYLRNPEAARSLGMLMALGERVRARMALGAAPHDLLACARRVKPSATMTAQGPPARGKRVR
jgi:hypothetical protein